MGFCLHDEDGYVADFATVKGAYDYLTYLRGLQIPELEEFAEAGFFIVPEALLEILSEVEVPEGPMQSTHESFLESLPKCKGIVIIWDGG